MQVFNCHYMLLVLTINISLSTGKGLSGPEQDSLSHSLPLTRTHKDQPTYPPIQCILSELLASLMGKEGTRWTGREETVGM